MESVTAERLAELKQLAEEIRDNTVCPSSRAAYVNSYSRFICWILQNHSPLIQPAFADRLGTVNGLSEKQLRARIKPLLTRKNDEPPLHFDNLDPEVFQTWLLTLRKADGSTLSYSALNTHRASLFNLYRDYGRRMDSDMENELKQFFKGIKRELAVTQARGVGNVKVGKDPLSFERFEFLSSHLMALSGSDAIFSRVYLIISWNLMCRSANAFGICHSHIEWHGDSLRVFFAHMKNDQGGERPRDPRHVYANPLQPTICPILALAIYWATTTFDDDNRLFPGSDQYERFRKSLQRLLVDEQVAAELKRQGVHANDLGTHSIRKGAATYCASGSTACPSSTAVHLRAGWSLGGVQNTYLRYEAAGDMHVGRTVTGLPSGSHEFAILPPHFEQQDEWVHRGVVMVFRGIPEQLVFVGEYCLASLVYHIPFLRRHLPLCHPLYETALFQDSELLVKLSDRVRCGFSDSTSSLKATGVPPHVDILGKMKAVQDMGISTIKKLDDVRREIVNDIVRELEERAIGAKTVTFEGLHDALRSCLREAGIQKQVNTNNLLESHHGVEANTADEITPQPTFFWAGRFRRIPPGFAFPECSVAHLWVLWRCGHAEKQIPPLYLLDGADMPNRDNQKRLSDIRYLMKKIEAIASERNLLSSSQTVEEAIHVYTACASSVEVPSTTASARKRRRGQLSWTSIVRLHRIADKNARSNTRL